MLRGLTFGRPALGDRSLQGLVWWAKAAQALPSKPITPELTAFWRMLNRACVGLIGEEYPVFAGDPRAVARAGASGQQRLAGWTGASGAGPEVPLRLAARLSPRARPRRQHAPPLARRGQRWRAAYLQARAESVVAGFAFFDFRFENSPPAVVRELSGSWLRSSAQSSSQTRSRAPTTAVASALAAPTWNESCSGPARVAETVVIPSCRRIRHAPGACQYGEKRTASR